MSDITAIIPHLPERHDLIGKAIASIDQQTLRPASIVIAEGQRGVESIAASRNRAIATATTKYVAPLDDDDEWLPNHLELLYAAAVEHDADVVYSIADKMAGNPHMGVPFDPARAREVNIICPAASLLKRETILRVGGYECPHVLKGVRCPYVQGGAPCCFCDEFGLCLKLMDIGAKFVHVPKVTLRYNDHPDDPSRGSCHNWDNASHKWIGPTNWTAPVAEPVERIAASPLWTEQAVPQYRRVAPLGTADCRVRWEGRLQPWRETPVTACIAHLDTIDALKVVLLTLRNQTVRPYILVIDTGSPPDVCSQLEGLRAQDVEVHYVRAHAYSHSSEPVSVALDVAHALCRTEYLYHTHSDVFLMRRDFLAWCLERCNASCPVVGYEMSPRAGTEDWRGTPSHTATMLHMPAMDRIGAAWSIRRWWEVTGTPRGATVGWPDTESMFGVCLKDAGIKPLFITPETCPGSRLETNYERHVDVNLDHVRSFPGSKIYGQDYHRQAQAGMAAALREARQRVARWQRGQG